MASKLLVGLAICLSSMPAIAQDGSGATKERTKASAQEFMTKVTETGGFSVEARAVHDRHLGFNVGTDGYLFQPGQVTAMAQDEKDDCVTRVQARYTSKANHPTMGPVLLSPMSTLFTSDITETSGFGQSGWSPIYWKHTSSVTRSGSSITLLTIVADFRFNFNSEQMAERFGQAMEFMRTQCDATSDLAF